MYSEEGPSRGTGGHRQSYPTQYDVIIYRGFSSRRSSLFQIKDESDTETVSPSTSESLSPKSSETELCPKVLLSSQSLFSATSWYGGQRPSKIDFTVDNRFVTSFVQVTGGSSNRPVLHTRGKSLLVSYKY